ncbi:MAG: non-hydrolyzing UDP-N-acetylglucosamine 2-epimerase [Bacillota bacterium]
MLEAKPLIVVVFGTRPEAIKMAPVVRVLKESNAWEVKLIVTAQHREMLDQVLDIFELKPDYDLNLMQQRQSLAGLTTRVLKKLSKIFADISPDLVLVHGDTTTTFSAALAAYYNQIAVGHVEAGLRTGNKYSPFPEEVNRGLTGVLADIHFAPTQSNYDNLIKENIDSANIYLTGNTVIDAAQQVVQPNYEFSPELPVREIENRGNKILVMTAHRRENLGKPLNSICTAVRNIVAKNSDVEIIFPVHLNPGVREIVNSNLAGVERVHLIEPLGYKDFINLVARAEVILTDSGGLQEEAPALNTPVVLLRDTTERPEGVKANTVLLAGTEQKQIEGITNKLLQDKDYYKSIAQQKNPYGDGKAALRVRDGLLEYFNIARGHFQPFQAK